MCLIFANLRELPNNLWEDLPALESIDLSWNDFRRLNRTSLAGMSRRTEKINLRNNEALKEVLTRPKRAIRSSNISGRTRHFRRIGPLALSESERCFSDGNRRADIPSAGIGSAERNFRRPFISFRNWTCPRRTSAK